MRCRAGLWFLPLAVAACGGAASDTGLEAAVRVTGGQFYRGAIDKLASMNAPAVVDVLNSQNVITPGLQNKQISGRLDPGSTAVAIGFAGDVGYWILAAGVPDADSPTQPTFHASLSFSPSLSQTSYDLIVLAVAPPNSFGPAVHVPLDVEQSLPPTGALVVSLWWDTEADLDLHVVDAYGVEIWAGNINSYDQFAAVPTTDAGAWNEGGILDFDSNAGCNIDGRCNENVVWAGAAPPGRLCGPCRQFLTVRKFRRALDSGGAAQRSFTGQGGGRGAAFESTLQQGQRQWHHCPVIHCCIPMRARAIVFALAVLAAMPEAVAWASDVYETVVIAPRGMQPAKLTCPRLSCARLPARRAMPARPWKTCRAWRGRDSQAANWWCGARRPEETRVVIDGMEIPALYHLGGLRSVVHTWVSCARWLWCLGATAPSMAAAWAAWFSMASREPPVERYQGEVDADVLDASFAAGAAVGNGGGVLAAGRFGYVDRIFDGALSSDTRRLFPLPRYRDFQGKLVFPLRDDERVEMIFLTSSDANSISNNAASPSSLAEEDRSQSFSRLGVRYVRAFADGSGASLIPFVGWDRTRRQEVAGLGSADESIASTVLGLRGEYGRASLTEADSGRGVRRNCPACRGAAIRLTDPASERR